MGVAGSASGIAGFGIDAVAAGAGAWICAVGGTEDVVANGVVLLLIPPVMSDTWGTGVRDGPGRGRAPTDRGGRGKTAWDVVVLISGWIGAGLFD